MDMQVSRTHLVSQLGGLGASGHSDGINQVADLVNGGGHLLVEGLQRSGFNHQISGVKRNIGHFKGKTKVDMTLVL